MSKEELKPGDLVITLRNGPGPARNFAGRILRLRCMSTKKPGLWLFDPPLRTPEDPREWGAKAHVLKRIPPLADLEGVRSEDIRKTDLGEAV